MWHALGVLPLSRRSKTGRALVAPPENRPRAGRAARKPAARWSRRSKTYCATSARQGALHVLAKL